MKKRRIELFAEYDCTGISRHLEKMAAKGWMIEKISNYSCWTYRRTEPKKVHFAVSYYGNATVYDPQPTEKQERFYEFCAHTGWELICTKGPIQIFCNEQEKPVPIETEPMLEVEAIHTIAKGSLIAVWATLICGCLMWAAEMLDLIKQPHIFLAEPSAPYIGVLFGILFAVCGVELISYSRWHKKAKLAAEQGEFCSTFSTAKIQKWLMMLLGIAFVAWVTDTMLLGDKEKKTIVLVMVGGVALLFVIVNVVTITLRKRKVDSDLNGMISLLLSVALVFILWFCVLLISIRQPEASLQDISPLGIEDVMDVSENSYSTEFERKESRFLRNRTVSQLITDSGMQEDVTKLEYLLVEVKLPSLYRPCKKSMLKSKEKDWGAEQKEYVPVLAAAWGAEEAYRLHSSKEGDLNTYLLCYEDNLVQIEFTWNPTAEQKAVVGQKLGNGSK